MKETITILVTGAGAPGIQGTIYALRNNYDRRNLFIIGTDMNELSIGKYLCDDFHVIAPVRQQEQYLADIKAICVQKGVDILIPQNTAELPVLALRKEEFAQCGVQILVSGFQAIETANNKYKLFQIAAENQLPVASCTLVSDFHSLQEAASQLGWPHNRVVVKPPVANGSRGIRIIAEEMNRKRLFYEEKPNHLFTTMNELHAILGDDFPELIVMEYLPGDEYTVDVFRAAGHFTAIPRKRLQIKSGITFAASLEKNDFLIRYSRQLAEAVDLQFCFGFQYKLDKDNRPLLLESNPRVQGTMVMSVLANANIIYDAIKIALGEEIREKEINWDCKLLRYWGAIGTHEHGFERI